MELEGGRRNSVIKRRNLIEFELVWFVLMSTLILKSGIQGQDMELKKVAPGLHASLTRLWWWRIPKIALGPP